MQVHLIWRVRRLWINVYITRLLLRAFVPGNNTRYNAHWSQAVQYHIPENVLNKHWNNITIIGNFIPTNSSSKNFIVFIKNVEGIFHRYPVMKMNYLTSLLFWNSKYTFYLNVDKNTWRREFFFLRKWDYSWIHVVRVNI